MTRQRGHQKTKAMIECRFTLAGVEPLSLDVVKSHLNITHTEDDEYLCMLLRSAREDAEMYCGRSFVTKTIEYFNDEVPDSVTLPYPDHNAIVTVTINGETATYKKTGLCAFRLFLDGEASGDDDSGLYVKYTTLGICPDAVKRAILMIVDERYRNRGNTVEGSVSMLSENAFALLAPYVI